MPVLPEPNYNVFTITHDKVVSTIVTNVHVSLPIPIEEINKQPLFTAKALWDTGATNSLITKKHVFYSI